MQKYIQLFVEGITDRNFLQYFIKQKFPQHWQHFKYKITNGKYNIANENIKNELREVFDNDDIILFVFDADADAEKAKNDILSKMANDMLPDIFLFPNNQDIGVLENLLEKIISEENKEFYHNCWTNFYDCVEKLSNKQNDIHLKTRFKCYCEIFLKGNTEALLKDAKIDYTDTEVWNLHHESLTPLYNFLNTNLQIFLQNP